MSIRCWCLDQARGKIYIKQNYQQILHKIRTRIAKSFQRTPPIISIFAFEVCFNPGMRTRLIINSAILNLTNKTGGGKTNGLFDYYHSLPKPDCNTHLPTTCQNVSFFVVQSSLKLHDTFKKLQIRQFKDVFRSEAFQFINITTCKNMHRRSPRLFFGIK